MANRNRTLGKRERKAGKRHRRAAVTTWTSVLGADGRAVAVTLKYGRKHSKRVWRRQVRAVADAEKRITGAPENC